MTPRLHARLAGFLYLIVIIAGSFALYTRMAVTVKGDAAATAAQILAAEPLYRMGLAADLIANASYIAVTALLYVLFKPAGRSLSLAAAFFSLMGLAVSGANLVNSIAPLVLLSGAPFLGGFTPEQLHGLAYASMRLFGQGYTIATAFFGFYCFLLGLLVLRSRFMPKFVGLLMLVAGTSWLVDAFAVVLAPALAADLAVLPMVGGIAGEGTLTLWLLLVGVDSGKWRAQAAEQHARTNRP